MKLLAFETATEACSVAVYDNGDVIERFEIAPRRHAELALPWAQDLLAQAGMAKSQLDAIAISKGPGAFTGVRLAIALAQGIALALDRPIVAVSTLRVLACRAGEGSPVVASIDARMGEIYAASFDWRDGKPHASSDEIVIAPDAFELAASEIPWRGVGSGFSAADGVLQKKLQSRFSHIDASALPHAADVAALAVKAYQRGEAIAPERIEPTYLRNNVALTLEEQKALRASR